MNRRLPWVVCAMLLLGGCAKRSEDKAAQAPPPSRPEPSEVQRAPEAVTEAAPPAAPSPEMSRESSIEPRTATAPRPPAGKKPPFKTIRVFYGTNRAATGYRDPSAFYGTEPGPLTFGFCDVSIPNDHEIGELESPKLWKFEFREDPKKHVVLLRVLPASGPEFLTALQTAIWDSIEWKQTPTGPALLGGEAFVFVHGFNNSFEDATRRAAQIANDLKFRGAPIVYSWPSQGSPTLRGYQDDGSFAGASEQHFLTFLAGVMRESGARKVHVIAHSMGNRVVAESLRKLSWHFESGGLPRINQVILAAPDIDAEYFRHAIAPRLTQTADRITIYSSSKDIALQASHWVNTLGRRRLGEAGEPLATFPGFANIDVVDASSVETDLFTLRHSYHANSPTVLGDIELVLQGLPPDQRGLKSMLGHLAWRIQEAGRSLGGAVRSITAERNDSAAGR